MKYQGMLRGGRTVPGGSKYAVSSVRPGTSAVPAFRRSGGLAAVYMVLLTLAVLAACTAKTPNREEVLPMDFLSGEFTYMADAATFRDCATGLRFPVAQTGDYLRTEREYTARSQGVGDPVHVRLRGHIDLMPSAEESQGFVPTLVIDSLLGFDDNQACNPGVMMVGIYVSEDGSGRSVLHLRSDYTCSFQNYGADGSAERREGRWGLVAEEELALLLPPPTLTEQMPVLEPDAGSDEGMGRDGANGTASGTAAGAMSGDATVQSSSVQSGPDEQWLFEVVSEQGVLVRNNGTDKSQVFRKEYL